MPATTANLVVGGGDYGAPSADAARPKPSKGGTALATMERSDVGAMAMAAGGSQAPVRSGGAWAKSLEGQWAKEGQNYEI